MVTVYERLPPPSCTPSEMCPGMTQPSITIKRGGLDGDLNVLLRGNRLEIMADVDREGIRRLKEVLTKYEEILALLEPDSEA
jgi:hypothetical protein